MSKKPTKQLGKKNKDYYVCRPLVHTINMKVTFPSYSLQETFLKKAQFLKALLQYKRFLVKSLHFSKQRYRIAAVFC